MYFKGRQLLATLIHLYLPIWILEVCRCHVQVIKMLSAIGHIFSISVVHKTYEMFRYDDIQKLIPSVHKYALVHSLIPNEHKSIEYRLWWRRFNDGIFSVPFYFPISLSLSFSCSHCRSKTCSLWTKSSKMQQCNWCHRIRSRHITTTIWWTIASNNEYSDDNDGKNKNKHAHTNNMLA